MVIIDIAVGDAEGSVMAVARADQERVDWLHGPPFAADRPGIAQSRLGE